MIINPSTKIRRYSSLLLALILSIPGYSQRLNFSNDIAPIIHLNCSPCHKPGGAAPFPLLSFDDVAKRTSFIRDVVQSGYMPPWKPDNKYVHFANDRSLSKEDRAKIVSWIDQGADRGPEYKKQRNAASLVTGTSYSRKPDLHLAPDSGYTVPGDNFDRFVIFKIPFNLDDSANVEAIEFTSNNKKLIHHANFAIHPVADSVNIDSAADRLNLVEQDRSLYRQYLPFRKQISYYGGWIPGTSFEAYPKDFGWVMPRRGVILLTVHYSPSAKQVEVVSGINFFFTKNPVKRRVKVISFGSGGIGEKDIEPSFTFIPPNKISTFTLKVTNPSEDQSVLYVWPHMHLLGKSFKAFAVSPQNDTIPLVHIPQWDFRWQEIYRVKNLIRIPKGSVINIIGEYDNTAENPFNPNSPPVGVFSFGDMKTDQEMMTLLMIFLPYKEGDETLNIN